MIVVNMHVRLPFRRLYQLPAISFATADKLENSEKRNAPVLEYKKKPGVSFKRNLPVLPSMGWFVKGDHVMN